MPSRFARVELFFGEEDCVFELKIEQMIELEEATDQGLGRLLARVSSGLHGDYRIGELKHILRCGLIGGGMDRPKAGKLVNRHVRPGYIGDTLLMARVLLEAALLGIEDEPVGESPGDGDQSGTPSLTDAPAGPTSTASDD